MKFSNQPLKRTPVELILDEDGRHIGPVATDRSGNACFDIPNNSGKILVAGIERYQGRLAGEIVIELWSLTETGYSSDGAATDETSGSNAYPGMSTRGIIIDNHEVLTDSEGYLVNPSDWSEEFVRQQASLEGLKLNSEHWEIIRFQRDWYANHGRQATVRDMIKAFRKLWGDEKGSNHYLHLLFPRGGPQKQGNRLAGLLRTKGEH
ncbi:MAG: TusE/DsrC/DsvC family sulfur relay protein [Gammaproteobacteria bacterium]|nr:TusE/DsrC/DsvC family sulfur relay protein [Gammaproteobacteria bacterium]